jgi:hypothetical protein
MVESEEERNEWVVREKWLGELMDFLEQERLEVGGLELEVAE